MQSKKLQVRVKDNKFNPALRALVNKSGVYAIYPKGEKNAVYIGHSKSNLYKTLTRHFQSWKDPRQARVSYNDTGGLYYFKALVMTPARAEKLERALIIKNRPKDNPNKLELYQLADLTRAEAKYLEEVENGEAPF